MNPDLAMGDELLKKTGAGNLFMVFGEPDIDVRAAGDGQTPGRDPRPRRLRPDDRRGPLILDRRHRRLVPRHRLRRRGFFVRHAYFTGADDPYDKLRRALRADIDEAAWATLNSTVSRPFPRPTTGKIAVKVINHYGDEVLKVYGV